MSLLTELNFFWGARDEGGRASFSDRALGARAVTKRARLIDMIGY